MSAAAEQDLAHSWSSLVVTMVRKKTLQFNLIEWVLVQVARQSLQFGGLVTNSFKLLERIIEPSQLHSYIFQIFSSQWRGWI